MSVALFNNGELINTGSDNANNVVYGDTTVSSVLDNFTNDEWHSINGISYIKSGNVVTVKSDGYPLTPTTTKAIITTLPEEYRPRKNIYITGYCGGYRAVPMAVDIMTNGEVAIQASSNQSYGGFLATYVI